MERAEAIKIIKSATVYTPEEMEALETLIPELRESEDERIRKWIYNLVSNMDPQDDDAEKELDEMKPLALTWLENQKENLMPSSTDLIDMWEQEKKVLEEKDFRGDAWRIAYHAFLDGFARGTCVEFEKQKEQKEPHYIKRNALFDKCVENCDPAVMKEVSDEVDKMLEKEQKHVEPSDEELQRHQNELYNFKVFAARQAKEHHISFVHDFEWNNFCEELLSYFNEKQKPADEQFPPLEGLDAIKAKYYDDGFKNGFDEGVESIKPAEWSEEDKRMIRRIIDRIKSDIQYGNELTKAFGNQEILFLKSLRPSWKPSEVQIKALQNAVVLAAGNKVLAELYEQLKQL